MSARRLLLVGSTACARDPGDPGERLRLARGDRHQHVDAGGHGGDSDLERTSFFLLWSTTGDVPDWPDRVEPHELLGMLAPEFG